MVPLINEITSMIRLMAPDSANRWSDARIKTAAHLADLAVCEFGDAVYASYEIELVDGAMYYDLPSDIVDVRSVEYSSDGVTYDTLLKAISIQELDRISTTWQDDTGTSPSVYVLLSVPSSGRYSRILLWRPVSATSGEKVRVNYTKCRVEKADLDAVSAQQDAIHGLYVPYSLALLYAADNASMAAEYMGEYRRNIDKFKVRFGYRGIERTESVNDLG